MFVKEDLLTLFLSGKISLSQIDYRFFSNLYTSATTKSGITSNQAALFDKLINKYARQLKKNGVVIENALSLNWKAQILTSDKEFTSAKLKLDTTTDNLVLNVPFNKKFIKAANQDTRFLRYHKENKNYVGPFTTRGLKQVINLVKENFSELVLCDTLTEIINDLKKYEAKIYNPTLVEVNGLLVVMACNPSLGKILETIKIEKSAKCLEELLMLGIEVDESVWKNNEKLKFAGSRIYEINNNNVVEVVKWLDELGYSGYVITRAAERLTIKKELVNELDKTSMTSQSSVWQRTSATDKLVVFPHTAAAGQSYLQEASSFRKVIVVKDSSKVEVK